jgi:hypothetical protein
MGNISTVRVADRTGQPLPVAHNTVLHILSRIKANIKGFLQKKSRLLQ